MVLQQARSFQRPSHPQPNPARIVGMAGAIALNAALLMLLLVPMAAPIPMPSLLEPVIPIWNVPEKLPTPTPPEPAEVVRPPSRPQATTRLEISVPPVDQVVVDDGTLEAEPVAEQPVVDTGNASIEPPGPIAGVRLEYALAPAPPYPRKAQLAGLQGVVMLKILVDVDGQPLEVSIHRSSGHRELDDAARRFVLKRWSFRPAMKDGRAVQATGLVPIDFNLGR